MFHLSLFLLSVCEAASFSAKCINALKGKLIKSFFAANITLVNGHFAYFGLFSPGRLKKVTGTVCMFGGRSASSDHR